MQNQVSCTPWSAHITTRFSSTPSSQDAPCSIHLSSFSCPPTTSTWGDSPAARSLRPWLREAAACREQPLLCTWYGLVPGLILEILSPDKAEKFRVNGKDNSYMKVRDGGLERWLGGWEHFMIMQRTWASGPRNNLGTLQSPIILVPRDPIPHSGIHTYWTCTKRPYMQAGRQPLILIKQNQ